MPQAITDTGIKGFLKWYQREQPDLFNKLAPVIKAKVPQAFADYNANMAKIYKGSFANRVGLGRLGYSNYAEYAPISTSYDLSSPLTAEISLPDVSTPAPVAMDSGVPSLPPIAGNSNTTPIAQSIGGVIAAGTAAYLTVAQQQNQNAILQTQLQRAAQGLPPLNVGMNSYGVPTVSSGMSSGTLLILGLLVGGAALLASK